MNARLRGLLQSLGPGLLFAGAAIGVSHLVQSTRAGATYGFALVWVLKYPFFEFGPRYAAATGDNLLTGYRRIGNWVFFLFLAMTVLTMFVITAAVGLVTAALASKLIPLSIPLLGWCVILFAFCAALLIIGNYAWLDSMMKVIIVLLSITTLIAFIAAAFYSPATTATKAATPSLWNLAGLSFLMALIGWMPTPIECSVWHSIWTQERREQTQHAPTLEEASFDFNVGYIGTMFLALAFLGLGALVMFGTGKVFPAAAVKFAGQLIKLYTQALGAWSYWVIGVAAFLTMISTTLTVVDAYPRLWQRSLEMSVPSLKERGNLVYNLSLLVLFGGALLIISMFLKSLRAMVDFATILSFLTAPFFAWINYRVVTDEHMPEEARPPKWLRVLSWIGMIFLTSFSLLYAGWRIWKWMGKA